MRAKSADVRGALADFDHAIENERNVFDMRERGILKQMMGNLPGALADLNVGLKLEPDDYEGLEHRGYVRFLMKKQKKVRSDAVRALTVLPSCVSNP